MSAGRKGKMQIGGHFEPADVFTLQELLMRESRERGTKKTMQEALEEMVADYCKKHGVTLPSAAARETPGEGQGERLNAPAARMPRRRKDPSADR